MHIVEVELPPGGTLLTGADPIFPRAPSSGGSRKCEGTILGASGNMVKGDQQRERPHMREGKAEKRKTAKNMTQSFRAYNCVHYPECLSKAAHENGPLDCAGCTQRRDGTDPPEVENLSAYCRLLGAIFFPESYGHYILSE